VQPFIQVRGLAYAYALEGGGQVVALQDVDLTIQPGEFVALIGPNGSGKSTLARHFNALLVPTRGEVWVDGLPTSDSRHLWAVRQRVGMVFQNPENQFVASTVDEALALVGLTEYRTQPPQMLSGGQKQRVAIAGALATRPSCIVFDEPTSMLDPPGRRQVLEIIQRLNTEEGVTVVLITQSMDDAATAQRVLAMHAGRIVMDGSPEVVFEQEEQLRELGLDLPFAVEIAHRLRDRGIRLAQTPLTIQELAEALC
jgi:energy-coupling factor transport system ATP-binding protein